MFYFEMHFINRKRQKAWVIDDVLIVIKIINFDVESWIPEINSDASARLSTYAPSISILIYEDVGWCNYPAL